MKNCSNTRTIDEIRVLFQQIVQFRADDRTKTTKKTLSEVCDTKSVKPREQRTISDSDEGMRIRIPAVPSVLSTCKIISIQYSLQIECFPSGLSLSLDATIPLIIGSIPIRQQSQNIQPKGDQFGAPVPAFVLEQYPDLRKKIFSQTFFLFLWTVIIM